MEHLCCIIHSLNDEAINFSFLKIKKLSLPKIYQIYNIELNKKIFKNDNNK